MKFRLPFQIYRTGVISRSNSPRKLIYKFSKDNEAKVRKKASKINISYRAIISNYIYRFTHLPLKRTVSKIRSRMMLRSSMKMHNSRRNEFVFLQETTRANSTRRRSRTHNVTSEASDCNMDSTKCANFMCAKSTARILLKQKDLLCNKNSNKSVAENQEEVKPLKEMKNPPTTQIVKDSNAITNNTKIPIKKIEKAAEITMKEMHNPAEYKIKLSKPENSELKRLKRINHSTDKNRNYKVEDAPLTPVRMDNIVGVTSTPKKLPELPVQIIPKVEQVRPKDGPALVAPKRKHGAVEMTRNYKISDGENHSPPRMDNLLKSPKRLHDSVVTSKNNPVQPEGNNNKPKKYSNIRADSKMSAKNKRPDDKDQYLLKVDQTVNDRIPKTKVPARSLQKMNATNINVSERIKKYEELIKNSYDKQRSKSEGSKAKFIDNQLRQGEQLEKKEPGDILSPKLSPFAIAEIRRKYYPTDNPIGPQSFKVPPQMSIEVPLIERNNIRADTKMSKLYSQPKEQVKSMDQNVIEINPVNTGNLQMKHADVRNVTTCNSGAERGKDIHTFELDNSTDSLVDCTTVSTNEPTNISLSAQSKGVIPSASKLSIAPENKRNYSSSAIDVYREALNTCTDLINKTCFNKMSSNLTAASNQSNNESSRKRKMSTNNKTNCEIIPEVFRANINPQDSETLKQERKFSTDVYTKSDDRNSRDIDRNIMMNPNTNLQHLSQRNLSKRHCTIKVTSTLDNQENAASSTGAPDKLTQKVSYQYYHEQCTISKDKNNYEKATINIPPNPTNEAPEMVQVDAVELLTDEGYNKMLNEKTTLINDYIKWKMQLQKFGTPPKKCNDSLKYGLNLANKINKQSKYKVRKYKIMRRKPKSPSNNNTEEYQDQTEEIKSTVNLIKTQVAQKCALFDKISDALLKKSDLINFCNYTKIEQQKQNQEKMENRDNKKRKLSVVPLLNSPPKKKHVPIQEMETKPVSTLELNNIARSAELKNLSPSKRFQTSPNREGRLCAPSGEAKSSSVRLVRDRETKSSPGRSRETKSSPGRSRETRKSPGRFEEMAASPVRETFDKEIKAAPNMANDPLSNTEAKYCSASGEINSVPILEFNTVKRMGILQTNSMTNSVNYEASNKKKSACRRSSFKLKGPKAPSREASNLELKYTNKNNFLQHSMKIKPNSIPATMKAKKFLAQIEAGPDQANQLLMRKFDKTIKGPKPKTKVLSANEKMYKFV